MHLHNFFPDKRLSSLTNFLLEELNLEGQWEVAVPEVSYPPMCQNVPQGKFMFLDQKPSMLSDFYCLELGLYPSITDIVESMNTFI